MTLDELCNGLLNALEEFDTKILPLGLYASDDLVEAKVSRPRQQEWHRCLLPWFQLKGGTAGQIYTAYTDRRQYVARIVMPSLGFSI